MVKNLPAKAGDKRPGLIPGWGRAPGGGNGNPTPVLLPGESHGPRSPGGYSPWGHEESDTTERLSRRHTCTHLHIKNSYHSTTERLTVNKKQAKE